MRTPLVMGNWKSHGTLATNKRLVSAICSALPSGVEVAVCPTFVHLSQAIADAAGTALKIGAQNVSAFDEGAYTGEVTAAMLRDLGVDHVIVGHSERRALFAESDDIVAKKVRKAVDAGLCAVVCVGETLEQRTSGETLSVIQRQLRAVCDAVNNEHWASIVIAYEPVWAIGTGKSASATQAQEVHAFIRSWLADQMLPAERVRILYGGSVKPENAAELFAQPDIDGGLIGGASLQAESFLSIVQAAVVHSNR